MLFRGVGVKDDFATETKEQQVVYTYLKHDSTLDQLDHFKLMLLLA